MNSKTTVLQKKTVKELTKAAKKAKEDLEDYLADLEMYSKPEFWEAINQAETGRINTYKSVKEYAKKMAKK
ncbi:MAG TPA: hypothetical protein VFF13_04305 [archaeon]|nr:hypothetical protein [archaeon]